MGLLSTIKSIGAKVVEDQKERLSNVGAVYKSVLTGKGATASIPKVGTTVNKIVSAAASNPFTTAAIAATVAAPAAAAKAVTTAFKALPTGYKVATVAAAPAIVSYVASSPIKTVKSISTLPSKTAQFAGNVGEFIENPSIETAKDILKENPLISGAIIGAAAITGGRALVGTLASVANTVALTQSTQDLKDLKDAAKDVSAPSEVLGGKRSTRTQGGTDNSSLVPVTPELTSLVPSRPSNGRKYSQKRKTQNINQSVRVNIGNFSKNLYNRRVYRY